ncbi:hypothetical protein [Vibrio crassostreae]|uniref:hypothetical protein n=1 Tax=Vibrio crassostreae TaxID=246167 RepID=UPI001B30446B|nr:hypothetical protein [Vibrio crassostreae]
MDTTNLLNGYRGEDLPEDAAPHVTELYMDAMIVLNSAKRKDEKTWWIRQLKAAYLQQDKLADKLDKKEQKFFRTRLSSQGTEFSDAEPPEIMEAYHHNVIDLDVQAINNFQYEQQTFDEVIDTFNEFETDYMAANDREVEPDWSVETVLKDYGNFVFVDLGVSGSRTEGDSMGHCGNGYGRDDQRVFSLREKQANGNLVPKATLIGNNCKFDDNGAVVSCDLGEIKGYANEKVSKKYRYFIADAIANLGLIESKVTGDYKPEVDLSLFDFNEAEVAEIVNNVPTYANPFEASFATNFEGGEVLDRSIEHYFKVDPSSHISATETAFFAHVLNTANMAGGEELRANVQKFLGMIESPTVKFFEMLPAELKSDMLQVAKAEGLTSESDLRDHMENKSSLSGFYNGLMVNYLKDDVYPALDEMTRDLEGVFGYKVVEKSRGQYDIEIPVNAMTRAVAEKITTNSEGNPMNNPESYRILSSFERSGVHYMTQHYTGVMIQRSRDNLVLRDALQKLQVGEFSNSQHLTMFSTFLSSAKNLMNIQSDEGLGLGKTVTPKSSVIASSGDVIVARVEDHKANTIAAKLGIDLTAMKDAAMSNFKGGDIKTSDLFNNDFAVIRKRGDDGIDEDIGLLSCGTKGAGRTRGFCVTRIALPNSDPSVVENLVGAITSDKTDLRFSKSTKFNRTESGTEFAGINLSVDAEIKVLSTMNDIAPVIGASPEVVQRLAEGSTPTTLRSRIGNFLGYLDSGNDFRVAIPSQSHFGESIPDNYRDNLREQFERAQKHFLTHELISGGWGNGDGGILRTYNTYLKNNDFEEHMVAHGGNEFKGGETVKEAMNRIATGLDFDKFESKFHESLEKKFERLKSKNFDGIRFVAREGDELVFNIADKAAFVSSLREKVVEGKYKKKTLLHFNDIDDMQAGKMLTSLVERKMINEKVNVEYTEAQFNKLFIGGVVGGMIRDVLGTDTIEAKNSFEGKLLGSITKGSPNDTQPNSPSSTPRPSF